MIALVSKIHLSPSREISQEQNAEEPNEEGKSTASVLEIKGEIKQKSKTMAELDEELRLKIEGISGEGGQAGVKYEGGKEEGLKRGVGITCSGSSASFLNKSVR